MRGIIPVLVGLLAFQTMAPNPARCQSGEPVFHAYCARCHGESGTACTPLGRALKAAPLENDPRLARMTTAQLMRLIKSDPKHRGVLHLPDADLRAAAHFVKQLARTNGLCPPPARAGRGGSR